jgi:hypothetical protein
MVNPEALSQLELQPVHFAMIGFMIIAREV